MKTKKTKKTYPGDNGNWLLSRVTRRRYVVINKFPFRINSYYISDRFSLEKRTGILGINPPTFNLDEMFGKAFHWVADCKMWKDQLYIKTDKTLRDDNKMEISTEKYYRLHYLDLSSIIDSIESGVRTWRRFRKVF